MAKDEPDDIDEGPSDDDLRELDEDQTDTRPCPKCGAEIYEDADRCPRCGQWVTRGDSSARRGLWVTLIVIIVAAVLVVWVLLRAPPREAAVPGPATAPASSAAAR